jgi:hypothetical protein
MHKSLFSLAVLAMLVLGCSQQNDPISTSPTPAAPKGVQFVSMNELLGGQFIPDEPVKGNSTSGTLTLSASADVTPTGGGVLKIVKSGKVNGQPMSINWSITFPPGAVNTKMRLNMVIAYDTMGNSVKTTFSPSPTTFNIPGRMYVDVTGIDTVRFGSASLGFFYVEPTTGQWQDQNANPDSIQVNTATRRFNARGMAIPHFSQYAFGRRTGN